MNIKSLFKLYTIPILALFLGFGLYYVIFVGTNKQKEDSSAEDFTPAVLSQPQMNYQKEQNKLEESSENIDNTDLASAPVVPSMPSTSSIPPISSAPSSALLPNSLDGSSKLSKTPDISKHPSLYVVLGKTLNIRKTPDISSEILGKLRYKQNIEVEFIRDEWAKLKDEGWVYARLLQPVKNTNAQEANPAEIPQEKAAINTTQMQKIAMGKTPSVRIYKTSKVINIRSKPTTSSKIVGKLTPNQSIEVRAVENGWAKVDGGFVLFDLLTRQSDNPTR